MKKSCRIIYFIIVYLDRPDDLTAHKYSFPDSGQRVWNLKCYSTNMQLKKKSERQKLKNGNMRKKLEDYNSGIL